ncbi:MAG: hypothetical protein AAB279_03290, partial [Candidatus Binatota bacterium]
MGVGKQVKSKNAKERCLRTGEGYDSGGAMEKEILEIRQAIRDIPNFPKAGIVFKDITPLLGNGSLFKR